jgi:catechol 2,3-dioxygenase
MGPVHLIVRDLKRSLGFYRDLLGLKVEFSPEGAGTLSAGDEPLVVLTERRDAPPRSPRSTGLYHFAILVPSRRDLARALKGLAQAGYPVQGASDHGVSEALYLADPEGNGIEIYRDRDRTEWPRSGDTLAMVTDPLDVRGLLSLAPDGGGPWDGLPRGTRIGHVHLHVSQIPAAEAFYTGALGFDLMQEYGPSAAFLSAGGYHHHIGVNTWAGVGAPPPPHGAAGLEALTIIYPTEDALTRAAEHLSESGVTAEEREDGLLVSDPSRNAIRLTTG